MSADEGEYWSILEPVGQSSSSCGYCGSKSDTSKSYGVWAHQLSPKVYQALMDRGWRRSGSYLYLPDRLQTCCPPYSIRCSASEFRPSRSQRQAVNRWRTFVEEGAKKPTVPRTKNSKSSFDLKEAFKSAEEAVSKNSADNQRRFQIKLEPASFSKEKFELYKKYQTTVHNDPADEVSESSFQRFLCTNPFKSDQPVAHHARWEIDGKMIAFSVLDILPAGISSVYLVWDPDYAKLGLGRVSALRELGWVQEWRGESYGDEFDWYYLGYYIHSCQKMRYKGEYCPSYLLDPTTLQWHSLESCIPILDSSSSNVTSFTSSSASEDPRSQDCPIHILTHKGKVERIKASDPKIAECVKMLGFEVLENVLICI